MPRDRLPAIVVLVLVVVALGAAAATLDSGQLPTDNATDAAGPAVMPDGGGDSSDAPERDPPRRADPFAIQWWTPPLGPVLGVVVLALVGTMAFLFVRTGGDDPVEVDELPDQADPDLQAVGEAAGDAADRIEAAADVDNEVYRAWREMVGHLQVPDPETTTPDEFESHAITAGMNPEDVAELTRLFAEVRYGERDPDGREERALAALRGIEATYADEGAGGDGGTDA